MDLEELRAARRRHPFRPFSIRLTDGRTFRVPEPEAVAIGPNLAIVVGKGDSFEVLDAPLVAALDYGRSSGNERRRRRGKGDQS